MITPVTPTPTPTIAELERTLEARAQAIADKYAAAVHRGVPDALKSVDGFIPFAGAIESFGTRQAAIYAGYNQGRVEARFMLDNAPSTAALIGAAMGDPATMHKWVHSTLYWFDTKLKGASRSLGVR